MDKNTNLPDLIFPSASAQANVAPDMAEQVRLESPSEWPDRGAVTWSRSVPAQVGFLAVLLSGVVYLMLSTSTRNEIARVNPAILQSSSRQNLQQAWGPVDQEFRQTWAQAGITPNPLADDRLIMRRMSLALTGMPPSLEQLRWSEQLPAEKRLDHFLAHLLEDRNAHDYLAERLTRAWIGTENGPFVVFRRRRFVDWLSERIGRNTPYDEIVQQMLTSRGLWTDNGAVNFYTAQLNGDDDDQLDKVRLTGKLSRSFLGMRLDCLQCHDDFTGTTEVGLPEEPRGGLQTDFHGLASFFSQTYISPTGIHDSVNLPTYSVELLGDTQPTTLQAAVPYGPDWSAGVWNDQRLTKTVTLRQQLSDWLTHADNRPFARSLVNRMWGLLLGRPLVEPVDDVPLYGPFPPGLESLTDQFIAHDFDLRFLISVIVNSEAFRVDSRSDAPILPEHERLWASFPLTKIRPEQMAGTISQVASLSRVDDRSHVLLQVIRFGEQGEFLTRFGDLGDDEFFPASETISQRLLLFNGEMVGERLSRNGLPFNSVRELNALCPDHKTLIRLIYNIVLTREPSEQEMAHFLPKFSADPTAAIEDTLWVLVNSSESLWNH